MGFLAAFLLVSLYTMLKKSNSSNLLIKITLLISFLTFVMFAIVGSHGGEIPHSEIRSEHHQDSDNLNIREEEHRHDD